jgi:cytochrome P450
MFEWEGMQMETKFDTSLPILPVETPEFSANPNPYLEAARQEHPWLARFSQGFIVHGYQAAENLLADDTNLVPGYGGFVDFYGEHGTMWARFQNEAIISRSGVEHKRLRGSVAQAFTPRHANQLRPLMQQVITGLLDEWVPKGEFDFAEFASFFPVTVICGVLGVSAEAIPRIRSAMDDYFALFTLDPDLKPLIMPSWNILWSFADNLVTKREAWGEYDPEFLLDAMIAAKNDCLIDEEELRFLLIFIVQAGYDTSKNMLSFLMSILLERPEMYERCADDKDFCGNVVQEALRYSSIGIPFRTVATDFTYEGFVFRKGERLVFPMSLAGRDPLMFPDPLTFDPQRANGHRHVAFGRGVHICLGQYIARAQLQEGLHLIAQRIRNPRLNGEIAWQPFLGIWGLKTLPIVFTPG